MTDKVKSNKQLENFKEEFGKVLDPVAYLNKTYPDLCTTFLQMHEQTLSEGTIPRRLKLLIHSAITASQHDNEATSMHILGAIRAGASENEIQETAFAIIPVAGMPAFAVFLSAWDKVISALNLNKL